MAKYLTLKLPCKLYIARFVQQRYGKSVKADNSSVLGFFVKMALEKKRYENRNLTDSFIHKGYEGTIDILVNKWQVAHIGFDISTDNIMFLNRFLEEQFQEALYYHCLAYVKTNEKANKKVQGYKVAIEKFAELNKIEIDFDITYDGLKKMEYRQRRKQEVSIPSKNEEKDCARLSPIFSTYQHNGELKSRPIFYDFAPGEPSFVANS